MRLLVQGAGGVGGVIAGELVRAGHDVHLVTGNEAIAAAIRERDLEVRVPGETFTAAPGAVYVALAEADGPYDVALLAMKATAVVEAAGATAPLLAPDGYVVPLQNGVVEDDVAAAVGADRVVSGIVGWGATLVEPGVCERTSPGTLHIGELDGRDTPRLRDLTALLQDVTPVVATTNIRGALWSKLAINCTITTVGALTGETLGGMLARRPVRELFLELYREVVDTAEAHGIELERIAADPRALYVPRDAGWLSLKARELVLRIVGRKYHDLRSSSLQSLERGRPTEVEFLNGYVVRKAREIGRDAPASAALVAMIHEIERGDRPLAQANVDELLGGLSI